MPAFATAPFASAASIDLMQRVVGALPSSLQPLLVQETVRVMDFEGLEYERGILMDAALNPSRLGDAMALFQRFGRLSYAVAPHAEKLRSALGMPFEAAKGVPDQPEDRRVQAAWKRFTAMELGIGEFAGESSFYDPVGAMSHGINHYLERQGRQARQKRARESGETYLPAPSFGVLSRENPVRLASYNRGENDQLGNLQFDFSEDLQMTVVPRIYGDLFRRSVKHQIVIPASDILDDTFNLERARQVPDGAVIEISTKGLPEGKMAREILEARLKEAEKNAHVLGIYGFLSASKVSKEQRAFRSGRGGRGDLLDIVVTCRDKDVGVAYAKERLGSEFAMREETFEGVPVVVLENLNFNPPVRYTIVWDPDVLRTTEKASTDKNLQAIYLGGTLFNRMLEGVNQGQMGDPLYYKDLARFYDERMEQAETDILAALALENIPEDKRVLLPGIRKDLFGSWTTKDFEPLYQLVAQIFTPGASKEQWQEAMVLLKLRIGDYYSVRNPQYGFCAALDRAAVMRGLWLSRQEVQEVAARLKEKGMLIDREGRPMSEEAAAKRLGLNKTNGAHFFFSTIPENLLPEGYQIADQLPVRYGRRSKQAPQSYQEAHLLVQRMQHSVFFDSEVYRHIVDLTRNFADIQPTSDSARREAYVALLEALNSHFEKGLGVLIASKHVFPRARNTEKLLTSLVRYLKVLITRVGDSQELTPEDIALLNQGVIEALTKANLFYILPPEEGDREAKYLMDRMKNLLKFAKTRAPGILFPSRPELEKIDPVIAQQLGGLKEKLAAAVGGGLIELTYRMNVRLHSEDKAITEKNVTDALTQIRGSLDDVMKAMAATEPMALPLVAMMAGTLDSALRDFNTNKLSAQQRLLVYQAIIESLIHTRRFLVLPTEQAGVEVQFTARRFQKIYDFIHGEAASPLWHFGNGNSTPPPPSSNPQS